MDVSGNIRRESTARSSIVIMLFVCLDNPINLYGCAASRRAISRCIKGQRLDREISRENSQSIDNRKTIINVQCDDTYICRSI